jgi:hypothetical protein
MFFCNNFFIEIGYVHILCNKTILINANYANRQIYIKLKINNELRLKMSSLC